MQMNSNIILSGAQPNILAAVQSGNEAGQQKRQFDQQNALAAMMKEQGPGILAGNQKSLNALAQFDPEAALGVQSTRLGMDQTRQNMQFSAEDQAMAREQAKRQAAAHLAQMSADEAASEAANVERALAMATQAQTSEQWDMIMQQSGQSDLVGQFGAKDIIIAGALGLKDALETFKADAPPNAGDRFKVVGSQLVDLSAEGGPAAVLTSPGQTETIYGPDGKPILTRGPAGSGKPFTEGQSKDIGFSTRARAALTTLDPIADTLTSRGDRLLDLAPMGLGREMQGDNYQVASNAATNFLLAILRKDTGAAVTPSEEAMYGKVFIPQPGDNAALLEQKKRARELAIAGLEQGMPADALLAQGRAIMQATGEKTPPNAGAGSGSPSFDPAQLSPEAAAVLKKYSTPATP